MGTMIGQPFSLGFEITKVDQDRRCVWGYATVEQPDKQGDIVDYQASVAAFQGWPGNIREQHDPKKAIGKAIDWRGDPDKRAIWLGAYISKSPEGEAAWTKVQEGILKGYSIKGEVQGSKPEVQVADDGTDRHLNRITKYRLDEVSLVDNPACPDAMIHLVKSVDGALLAQAVLSEPEALPADLEQVAGAVAGAVRAGRLKPLGKREQVKQADAGGVPTEVHMGDMDAHGEPVTPPETPDADGEPEGENTDDGGANIDASASVGPGDPQGTMSAEGRKTADGGDLEKSEASDVAGEQGGEVVGQAQEPPPSLPQRLSKRLVVQIEKGAVSEVFQIQDAANILSNLAGLIRSELTEGEQNNDDGDGSGEGRQDAQLLLDAAQRVLDFISGEFGELSQAVQSNSGGASLFPENGAELAAAAGSVPSDLEKMTSLDQHAADLRAVQQMHDLSCDLGANCQQDKDDSKAGDKAGKEDDVKGEDVERIVSATVGREMTKALGTQGGTLEKVSGQLEKLGEAVSRLEKAAEAQAQLEKRVATLEAQPLNDPTAPAVRAVEKSIGDVPGGSLRPGAITPADLAAIEKAVQAPGLDPYTKQRLSNIVAFEEMKKVFQTS